VKNQLYRPRTAKTTLKKKNKAGWLILHSFRLHSGGEQPALSWNVKWAVGLKLPIDRQKTHPFTSSLILSFLRLVARDGSWILLNAFWACTDTENTVATYEGIQIQEQPLFCLRKQEKERRAFLWGARCLCPSLVLLDFRSCPVDYKDCALSSTSHCPKTLRFPSDSPIT
jgi:hypothetical protein